MIMIEELVVSLKKIKVDELSYEQLRELEKSLKSISDLVQMQIALLNIKED